MSSGMVHDAVGMSVRVIPDLETCLDLVTVTAPPIAREPVIEALSSASLNGLLEIASRMGFQLGSLRSSELKLYATARPDVISVVFDLAFELVGGLDDGIVKFDPVASAEGSAFYRPLSAELEEFTPERYSIRWKDQEGEMQQRANVFIRVGDVLGVRTVPWSVTQELPDAN